MFQTQNIMKNMEIKKENEKKSYKNYSNNNRIDLYTFTKQNRDICLKNILIDLLQSERDKISNKENAVSTALVSAKEELRKDMDDFTSFMETQKVTFRNTELALSKMVRDNKIRNERKKQLTQEVKNTQDEIEKTMRTILQYKTYADFIHLVLGSENEVSNVNLSNIDLFNKDRDLEKNISQIKFEFYFLDNDDKFEPPILKNPETMNYLFNQLEANILKFLDAKGDLENESYKEFIENQKIIHDLEEKEKIHLKELQELTEEYRKKNQMINDGGKSIQEQLLINSKFIKELYETICEPRSLSLGQGSKGKQINEIIKEILDVLNGKESMLNTLIEEIGRAHV